MFSNVNEVIHHLYLADRGAYRFAIDWSKSNYLDEDKQVDPWRYFFEDCYPDLPSDLNGLEPLPHGNLIVLRRDNIITPRSSFLNGRALVLPKNRRLPHKYIERHIHVKPHISSIIEKFAAEHFDQHTIGLHIRGEGRYHGGSAELRAKLPLEDGVPYGQYFKFVRQALEAKPQSEIFLCSDSMKVLRHVKEEFGERVFWYDSLRSDFGEMHERRQSLENTQFSGYRLGEDILVEAHLLARTDLFIHGSSNVANFVVCKNPSLPNIYVYQGIRAISRTRALANKFQKLTARRARD